MGSKTHRQTAKYLAVFFSAFALSACGEKKEAHGGSVQDSFKLTIMHIIKPMVTPNEENLRMD